MKHLQRFYDSLNYVNNASYIDCPNLFLHFLHLAQPINSKQLNKNKNKKFILMYLARKMEVVIQVAESTRNAFPTGQLDKSFAPECPLSGSGTK